MIHRDIKPQISCGCELASAWQYKILDFGLARFAEQPTVQSMENTAIYGSILYIAPERCGISRWMRARALFAGLHLLLFAVGLRRD